MEGMDPMQRARGSERVASNLSENEMAAEDIAPCVVQTHLELAQEKFSLLLYKLQVSSVKSRLISTS